jgi:nucleotide-binding universal stress UspA family protein
MRAGATSSFDVILVGIDFSDTGAAALDQALLLAAEREGARLMVVYVASPARHQVEVVLDDGVHVVSLEEAQGLLERYVEAARLRAIGGGEPIESERVSVHVRVGDCVEELLELARTSDAKLVVVGTHGRSGVRRLVLGSVAESVMRSALCPVLIVRPKSYPTHEGQ